MKSLIASWTQRLTMTLILAFVTAWPAHAQDGYAVDWWTMDGGGGTSTGGGFEVTGTIGQPDASVADAMTGGGFAVTGGFWGTAQPACTTFVGPDLDQDCDVDDEDFSDFLGCTSGPAVPKLPCGSTDFDGDGDTDQTDFAVFQRCLSGSGVPPRPACDD